MEGFGAKAYPELWLGGIAMSSVQRKRGGGIFRILQQGGGE